MSEPEPKWVRVAEFHQCVKCGRELTDDDRRSGSVAVCRVCWDCSVAWSWSGWFFGWHWW